MVTIVVAAHDRPEPLRRSVPRHLALPERPEVIVVDNASREPCAHPHVRVIRLERNLGGAGRNVGVRAARTPYVAFSDDDSWWRPGALAHAVAVLEAVVVRRSAFLDAGGFSERFAVGGEEEPLGWDLVAAGWQLSSLPEVVAGHHPPSSLDGRPGRRALTVRNGLWTAWLRRPVHVAARQSAVALAGASRDRATARGVRQAVAGMPWVLRERRPNPPAVEAMTRMLERPSGGGAG